MVNFYYSKRHFLESVSQLYRSVSSSKAIRDEHMINFNIYVKENVLLGNIFVCMN